MDRESKCNGANVRAHGEETLAWLDHGYINIQENIVIRKWWMELRGMTERKEYDK